MEGTEVSDFGNVRRSKGNPDFLSGRDRAAAQLRTPDHFNSLPDYDRALAASV